MLFVAYERPTGTPAVLFQNTRQREGWLLRKCTPGISVSDVVKSSPSLLLPVKTQLISNYFLHEWMQDLVTM